MSELDLKELWSNQKKRDAYIRDNKNYKLIEDALVRVERLNGTPFLRLSMEVMQPWVIKTHRQIIAYRKFDGSEDYILPFDEDERSIEKWMKNTVISMRLES